ncbi:MAG: UDP-N-acetylglucosamine 1-carboxyvinyltransferase [Armatimonadetes bacterium]|nr:UDP-N-acetylglucosamine 1-carboxyvinyltransferase [Armatimonadota bacterium]PIU64131.1 MAG: UDP-N-acetylglucosamine 1-carboxyvinyltransferase [Armatimonadetes bacterium CG07_land_8_20_14_0_80_59_28]PJB63871.1 MAG: UDP-N-acetylglucosamine 1-carboxyvinyltransferase [Armatimonadetes bacterium CG_4_9_14_3_um_filter_58_7]
MEYLRISGGTPLRGTVSLSGSKNAALAILAGALLTEEPCTIHNVPPIEDVGTMLRVLSAIGVKVSLVKPGSVRIDASLLNDNPLPYDLVKKMRASFYVSGALLGRIHRARVPLPGGCVIGARPVDFHINAFRQLGATVELQHGLMVAEVERLRGTHIVLDPRWCSVGATVNTMLVACLAEGETVIDHAAREPEVTNFADFLLSMGAQIEGAGTSEIRVTGVSGLKGSEFHVISDRIEAGSYLFMGAATGGDVRVEPISPNLLEFVLCKLDETGVEVDTDETSARVRVTRRPVALDVATAPFPGFPTDLQPLILALTCTAAGRSVIQETIYEGRLHYVGELTRMGANVKVVNQTAVVRGVTKLSGAPVESPDLRAGAALVAAGLSAEGQTEITGVGVIDRGYYQLEEKLSGLGADIIRRDSDGNVVRPSAEVNECSDWQEILASI